MPPQGFERKLSAHLGTHAVNYSRLTGEDNDPTVRTLSGHSERE